MGKESPLRARGCAGARALIGLPFYAASFLVRTSPLRLRTWRVLLFHVRKFPSSQQATNVSVTDFSFSQRARICVDSFCVI